MAKLKEIDAALTYAKERIEKCNKERDDLAKNLQKHAAKVEKTLNSGTE